jgi:hypothetical protein
VVMKRLVFEPSPLLLRFYHFPANSSASCRPL